MEIGAVALMEQALVETRDAFDGVAGDYDRANRANRGLQAMRRRALDTLTAQVRPGSRVIDLGCGPGTDAAALVGAGYRVTAIDWSPSMVQEARARVASQRLPDVEVRQLGIHQLDELSPITFDAAYSNFGPLNCVPDLPGTATKIAARLAPGGILVASVIGRWCPWEMGIYAWRRDFARLRVRLSAGPVAVPLAGGSVWTQYYTPRTFETPFRAAGFARVSLRTLGLFAPPPYLEGFANRHPALAEWLHALDDRCGAWPGLRAAGDHFLIVLRKR